MPAPVVPVIRINLDFQLENVPADGIRLPYSATATSVRRRFLRSSRSKVICQTAAQHTILAE
jgi:hypothetical protein